MRPRSLIARVGAVSYGRKVSAEIQPLAPHHAGESP